MRLQDFRIGWRLLAQQPAYSAVVLLGLATGFAACFLLLGFARYSYSYDAQVPDAQQVYVLKSRFNAVPNPEWTELAPNHLVQAARVSGLTQAAAGLARLPAPLAMRVGDRMQPVDTLLTDAQFAPVFGLQARAGDLQAALTQPDALALTLDTAQKLFGHADALGQTVHIRGQPFRVLALLDNPPTNTTLSYQALAGSGAALWPREYRQMYDEGTLEVGVYVRLARGVSVAALAAALQDAQDRSPLASVLPPKMLAELRGRKAMDIRPGALRDAYFDPDVRNSRDSGPRGDPRTVLGLTAVALLILALAAANYVNLAVVRTLQRRREIGVRKMMGAGALRIAAQFLSESVLAALLATIFGLLLAYLTEPLLADAVQRDLSGLFTPDALAAALLAGVVFGLASGAYPVWVALHVRAVHALAGRAGDETGGSLWLRRALTVAQFAVAMGLGGVTLAVAWQTVYAATADPGFDPAPLLVIDLPGAMNDGTDEHWNPAHAALRKALLELPNVAAVGGSDFAFGARGWVGYDYYKRRGSATVAIVTKQVSRDYFDAYDIKPLAGRMYDARIDPPGYAHVAVINSAAARLLGYATPQAAIGQTILTKDERASFEIVGIAPDLRHQSLREAPQPVFYNVGRWTPALTVRVNGDLATARQRIEAVYRRIFPDDVLKMASATELYAQNYADDKRLLTVLLAATAIAIVIASFGIYVLAAYSVQRRRLEIVVRKLHGARRADIGRMVGAEFAATVAGGAALGLPLAALATQRYLAGFAETAPIGPWALVAAFVLVAGAALLSTLRHSYAAMAIAPTLLLRN
jgi:putative ABC transport system permease protein